MNYEATLYIQKKIYEFFIFLITNFTITAVTKFNFLCFSEKKNCFHYLQLKYSKPFKKKDELHFKNKLVYI